MLSSEERERERDFASGTCDLGSSWRNAVLHLAINDDRVSAPFFFFFKFLTATTLRTPNARL